MNKFLRIVSSPSFVIDLETVDTGISKGQSSEGHLGPKGESAITAIAVSNGLEEDCIPIENKYTETKSENQDTAIRALSSAFNDPNKLVIGFNILYDLEFLLAFFGIRPKNFCDVQVLSALLDNTKHSYSLDNIAKEYLNAQKDELIYFVLAGQFGGKPNRKEQGSRIGLAPFAILSNYAEKDARMTWDLYELLWKKIKSLGLVKVAELEFECMQTMLSMRMQGIRIAEDKIKPATDFYRKRIRQNQLDMYSLTGRIINTNSAAECAEVLISLGVDNLKKTPKTGKSSVTKEVIDKLSQEDTAAGKFANIIGNIRVSESMISKFLAPLPEHVRNGRVYPNYANVPFGDDSINGTRTGRFSCFNPNIQQIPKRDKEARGLIRGLFIPEPGEVWVKSDYGQIEYRILVHYAAGQYGAQARQVYFEKPETDYHSFVTEMVKQKTGLELERTKVKNLNFGLIFGMGSEKMINTLGVDKETGQNLLSAYHTALPYVKATMNATIREVRLTSEIRTISGRRSIFKEDHSTREFRLEKEYKALNYRIQGSAADVMKKAMSQMNPYAGKIPLVCVHDELGFSYHKSEIDDFKQGLNVRMNEIPREHFGLSVPLVTDVTTGNNWGECD